MIALAAANWISLGGLVVTNILVLWPMVRRWWRNKTNQPLTNNVIPLKYFEQIQAGQSDYINTLETRILNVTELYRASEAEKDKLVAENSRLRRLLDDYMQRQAK